MIIVRRRDRTRFGHEFQLSLENIRHFCRRVGIIVPRVSCRDLLLCRRLHAGRIPVGEVTPVVTQVAFVGRGIGAQREGVGERRQVGIADPDPGILERLQRTHRVPAFVPEFDVHVDMHPDRLGGDGEKVAEPLRRTVEVVFELDEERVEPPGFDERRHGGDMVPHELTARVCVEGFRMRQVLVDLDRIEHRLPAAALDIDEVRQLGHPVIGAVDLHKGKVALVKAQPVLDVALARGIGRQCGRAAAGRIEQPDPVVVIVARGADIDLFRFYVGRGS